MLATEKTTPGVCQKQQQQRAQKANERAWLCSGSPPNPTQPNPTRPDLRESKRSFPPLPYSKNERKGTNFLTEARESRLKAAVVQKGNKKDKNKKDANRRTTKKTDITMFATAVVWLSHGNYNNTGTKHIFRRVRPLVSPPYVTRPLAAPVQGHPPPSVVSPPICPNAAVRRVRSPPNLKPPSALPQSSRIPALCTPRARAAATSATRQKLPFLVRQGVE